MVNFVTVESFLEAVTALSVNSSREEEAEETEEREDRVEEGKKTTVWVWKLRSMPDY